MSKYLNFLIDKIFVQCGGRVFQQWSHLPKERKRTLHIEINRNEKLMTKIYNKRDDFPSIFLSSVATSLQHQLTKFSHHNSYVMQELAHLYRARLLTIRLLAQLCCYKLKVETWVVL